MTEANKNLLLRVASAAVLAPVAVYATWRGELVFAGLCAAAAALAAAELVRMLVPLGLPELYGVAVAGLFPLAPWAAGGDYPVWAPVGLAFAAIGLLVLHVFRTDIAEVPRRASAVALAWIYVGPIVATVVSLRLRFGTGWVILALAMAFVNDTLAYFAGRFLGRHKMFARISPKKTWEGFAGGVAGSVLAALVVRLLDFTGDLGTLTMAGTVALALGAAVLGPLGDLAESMLKRAAGVKDSGRTIPGHGGLLDRIDALMFVAPWVWVYAAYLR
ncbi:MAG: CDP-archaeol synthase [Deltaproteobacteria bacterium]|nr:CDP-archaeol synthase [Deltaproteobacteria bacterium]